jgi:serine protease Do
MVLRIAGLISGVRLNSRASLTIGARLNSSASLLCCAVLMQGCVSFEPTVLVPALSLSSEDFTLESDNTATAARIDFGLETSLNESDSLVNIEILPGVRVRNVAANGAADSAGIQVGDIILSIDGLETNNPDVLIALQQQSAVTPEFNFIVRRNTAVFEATVVGRIVAANQAPRELYRADPIASRAGYRTELLSLRNQADLATAQVVEIFPDSPLPAAGIEVGDYIVSVNGVNLNSAQGLINRLNQDFALGDRVSVGVYDGESVSEVPLQLWDPGRRISRVSLWPLVLYDSSLSPPSNSLSVLDFWLFSIYSYRRVEGERSHSLLGLFNFTSDYGELTEVQD